MTIASDLPGERLTGAVWAVGRVTLGTLVRLGAPLRSYGVERVPREGGLVLALNHYSWLDPAVFGATSPRVIYYPAKAEVHAVPGLAQLVRAFGAFSIRRGESDREAVRRMRQVVRAGHVLGVFVEGTRQRSGVPGRAHPGAAMVAIREGVPLVAAAVHGTQTWRPGRPVSVAWGVPRSFGGLAANARGYREASARIEEEIERLSEFLVDMHALGRPRTATPPAG